MRRRRALQTARTRTRTAGASVPAWQIGFARRAIRHHDLAALHPDRGGEQFQAVADDFAEGLADPPAPLEDPQPEATRARQANRTTRYFVRAVTQERLEDGPNRREQGDEAHENAGARWYGVAGA